jgi:hypothetical protein
MLPLVIGGIVALGLLGGLLFLLLRRRRAAPTEA